MNWIPCSKGPDGFRGANWHPGWMTVEGGMVCCTCGVFAPHEEELA